VKKNEAIEIKAIRTEIFPVGGDIFSFLKQYTKNESLEGKVLAVTSKIVSLAESRIVKKESISKRELVQREADHYLCEGGFGVELTIKHGILIPSAGIDESNSETGDYILFPEDPFASAHAIWKFLKKEFSLENFGVILTDSHTMPLRGGVTGISLAHWGVRATNSLVGQPDIFRRPLKFTKVDVVDSLASMAVFASYFRMLWMRGSASDGLLAC
jgi:dihydrofolate synthase / folylpolyglutamate synthase